MREITRYAVLGIVAFAIHERADMLVAIAEYDVTNYGTNGHTMTVCWPNDGAKHAAVILLHQGGWTSGTRLGIIEQARALAREGVAVCSIDYTLASTATEPALPKVMQDIADAIAILSKFTCTKGMPVSLGGFSAGGHLALVYAMTQPNTLHAVMAVNAPTDMHAWEAECLQNNDPRINYLLGTGYTPETLDAASPMHMPLDGLTAPAVLFRGGADVFEGMTEMLPLYQRLTTAQKPVKLIRFEGGDHLLENSTPEWAGAAYPCII